MKFRTLILLVIFYITLTSTVFAVQEQKKMYGDTLVEMGTSTEDIVPLLAHSAGLFGKYFEHIYGQYRNGYVLIYMNRNLTEESFNEMEGIAEEMVKSVNAFFPSAKGEIELIASKSDLWDSIRLEFNKGKIINKNIFPSIEAIEKRKVLKNEKPTIKYGLTEEQRKQFAYEHDKLDTWSQNEAAQKYPNQWDVNRYRYEDSIFYPKESELIKKYGLTKEQAKEIIFKEAIQKKWY